MRSTLLARAPRPRSSPTLLFPRSSPALLFPRFSWAPRRLTTPPAGKLDRLVRRPAPLATSSGASSAAHTQAPTHADLSDGDLQSGLLASPRLLSPPLASPPLASPRLATPPLASLAPPRLEFSRDGACAAASERIPSAAVTGALVVFCATYLVIATQQLRFLQLDRPGGAVVGAVAMVILGGLPTKLRAPGDRPARARARAAVRRAVDRRGPPAGAGVPARRVLRAHARRHCADAPLRDRRGRRGLLLSS